MSLLDYLLNQITQINDLKKHNFLRRIQIEANEMRCWENFSLFFKSKKDIYSWDSYYWSGYHPHYSNYKISIFYPKLYPISMPKVYVDPKINNYHHHSDLELCWIKGSAWDPNWTVAFIVTQAVRYISDCKEGRL